MRRELVIGVCFAAAGVLCACLFGYEYFSTYGFLNAFHIKTFAEANLDLTTLLGNIVWKRAKLFFLIWLIAYTPARVIEPLVLRCGIIFTAGIFAGACMINMGGWGLVVFLGSWFPHGIFYVLAIMILLRRSEYKGYGGRNKIGRSVMYGLSIISLILIGCVSEATLGTWILQRLFRVSF